MSTNTNLLSEIIALSHSPIHNHLKEEDVKALRLEDEQTAEEFITLTAKRRGRSSLVGPREPHGFSRSL